ncbi:MAG: FtsX-like permease family protein, partial [Dehalococcoidia bacterium]
DLVRSALFNLKRKKLRSFLTIFAVVIGASLISLLVSLGVGTQDFLASQIKAAMPPDVLMVASNPNAFDIGFGGLGIGGSPQEISEDEGDSTSLKPLKLEDIESVQALEHIEGIDPYVILSAESVGLKGSRARFEVEVRALPEYQVADWELVAGTYVTDQSQGECIIANQYLGSFRFEQPQDALGQEIVIRVRQAASLGGLADEVKEYNFKIVGVTERTLSSTQIVVPISDAVEMARFWEDNAELYTEKIPPAVIQVRVNDSKYVDQVAERVRDLGLGAVTADELLGFIGRVFGVIKAVLSVFGLIALGVASLGIINTLIMAIYERTREIGLMKAVGASKRTIRLLFTMEGASIGFLGGSIGVAIGIALGYAVNRISHVTFLEGFQTFNLSVFPWWLITGVIALSTLISLLAALYPSHRASELDPIEALRYE